MSDRELLEFAAKAAGIHVPTKKDYPWAYIDESGIFRDISCAGDGTRMSRWNPITDDGDAMRLMVKLELDIFHSCISVRAIHRNTDMGASVRCKGAKPQLDPYSATRRAIVRAAAEIGRSMK